MTDSSFRDGNAGSDGLNPSRRRVLLMLVWIARAVALLPVFALLIFGGLAVQWLGERSVRFAYWLYDRADDVADRARLDAGRALIERVTE